MFVPVSGLSAPIEFLRKLVAITLCFGLLGIFGAMPKASMAQSPASSAANLQGSISDFAGKAISNARVSLTGLAQEIDTDSDSSGAFQVQDIPLSGDYQIITVTIQASGYGVYIAQNNVLYRNNTLILRPVVLETSAQVVDAGGLPTSHVLSQQALSQTQSLPPGHPLFYSNDSIPPTIRVAITGHATCGSPIIRIDTLPFEDYVKGVLPNEWIPTWNIESLRAGAVAIKMYAWWKINIGPENSWNGQAYDVQDNTCDQVYGNTYASTNAAVDDTWGSIMRRSGQVIQIHYVDGSLATCAGTFPGQPCMEQWGSQNLASQGWSWQAILHHYYDPVDITGEANVMTANFDGDCAADFSVFANNTLKVNYSHNGFNGWDTSPPVSWGTTGGQVIVGDFDGDGKDDFSLWYAQSGSWYLDLARTGFGNWDTPHSPQPYSWGSTGGQVITGDFDGDGKTDFSLFYSQDDTWYVDLAADGFGNWNMPNAPQPYAWGSTGGQVVTGDFDGDGKTDFSLFYSQDDTWYVDLAADGFGNWNTPHPPQPYAWGSTGGQVITGDFDGDGKTDFSLFYSQDDTWYVDLAADGFGNWNTPHSPQPYSWGSTGGQSIIGDFDGDGKDDFSLWYAQNDTWYVDLAADGFGNWNTFQPPQPYNWGASGGQLVIGDFDGDGKDDFSLWYDQNQQWYLDVAATGFGNWDGTPTTGYNIGLASCTVISPANAAPPLNDIATNMPTLTWNAVPSAVRYEIQVAGQANFSGAVLYQAGNKLAWTFHAPLTDGVYYWRVRACTTASSCGAWSATQSFRLNTS